MAIGGAYVDAAFYRARTEKRGTGEDAEILEQLIAISRFLEIECGQFFNEDAAVVQQVLVGDGTYRLNLRQGGSPGLSTATGLVVTVDSDNDGDYADEIALVNTTFDLQPVNAPLFPEPKPYTHIYLTNRALYGTWPTGTLVRVTGKRGWPAIPALVKEITWKLCAIWRGEHPGATQSFNELEQAVNESPLAMSLTKRFRQAYSISPVVVG